MLNLYAARWCPHCMKTEEFFKQNNIRYNYFDIEIQPDEVVKSHYHTKITEDTKKNLNVFNRPFFVPLCLRGEKLTFMKPS